MIRKISGAAASVILALVMVVYLPAMVLAGEYDIADGIIQITATGTAENPGHNILINDSPVYEEDGQTLLNDPSPVITGTSDTNTVAINAPAGTTATVTLNNVNINYPHANTAAVSTSGDVVIEFSGTNTLHGGGPGLGKGDTGTLTIQGADANARLTATGEGASAGIGGGIYGNGNNITINGGIITASSTATGAGIGGGEYGSASNINILSGTVTATCGGNGGAGIGGGSGGSGSNITISGGTIIANGGTMGAGIGGGGGSGGSGSNITISGGTVTATGGEGGAGIGGGAGNNITISGGDVTANGGDYGAGIGGGAGYAGSNITISGGTVIATGGDLGAGIGGGELGRGSNITISGGDVTANGGINADGIGGGDGSTGGTNIRVTGGTVVSNGETIDPIVPRPQGSPAAVSEEADADGVTGGGVQNASAGDFDVFTTQLNAQIESYIQKLQALIASGSQDILQAVMQTGFTLNLGKYTMIDARTCALLGQVLDMGVPVRIDFTHGGVGYRTTIPTDRKGSLTVLASDGVCTVEELTAAFETKVL